MVEDKIAKIGGKSVPGQIEIHSDRFSATASYKEEKDEYWVETQVDVLVECEVNRIDRLHRYPLPLIILYLLRTWKKDKSFVLSIALSFAPATIVGAIARLLPNFGFLESIFYLVWMVLAVVAMRQAATWHAAEHMAINAYWETGTCDLEMIRRNNRVSDRCGTRWLVAILLILLFSLALRFFLRVPFVVLVVISIELGLWVEKLYGWHKVPGILPVSRFLQKYFTTAEPGEEELETAQAALEELILAHKEANPEI